MIFPTLSQNPQLPIITEPIWDTSIAHYEGKVEQRKANRTTDKERFIFNYRSLSTADKELLRLFFISTMGTHKKFDWTNPETGATHIVRFVDEGFEIQYSRFGLWNVRIRLMEA